MLNRLVVTLLFILSLPRGCTNHGAAEPIHLKYPAVGSSPEVIAVYEAWFGHPRHISIGYSSHDPAVITRQIHEAQQRGISAFVVDWYGDREPFIDKSYSLMQALAEKHGFKVAMMYDETTQDDGATDEAIADFTMFHDAYLSPKSPGHEAYLTYQGRPVIFIFPTGKHTDWSKVRAAVDQWDPKPWLIYENLPGQDAQTFDGFYAWINGDGRWAPDGSDWGERYLSNFYETMGSKYPDKIIVGGAWASFDDSKASWGLNRRISPRCGQTYQDTFNFWHRDFPQNEPIPFLMIETWDDYEEGSAIEPGIPACSPSASSNGL